MIRFVDGTTYSFTGENGAHVVEPLEYQTRWNLKARSGVAEAGIAVRFVLVRTS